MMHLSEKFMYKAGVKELDFKKFLSGEWVRQKKSKVTRNHYIDHSGDTASLKTHTHWAWALSANNADRLQGASLSLLAEH